MKNKRLISKEKNRNKIINAMETLIKEKGYSSITIRELASTANVSIGLIYKNFPNTKPEIVGEIFKKIMKNMHTLRKVRLDPNKSEEIPSFIKNSIEILLKNHQNNQSLNKALELAYLENPDLRDTLKPLLNIELSYFSNLIIKLSKEGIFDIPDNNLWVSWLIQLIDSSIHRFLVHDEIENRDDKFIEFLTDLVLRALKYESKF